MLLKYLGFSGSKKASSSKKHYPTVIEELCHHFSLEDVRKSTNNFDKELILGEGGFGTVYKGRLKHSGSTDYTIALKRWNSNSAQGIREFEKEIELLCQLRHPDLVNLVGFCNHEKEKIIVYEYMPNGSLQDHLKSRDMEPLSWKKRLQICLGIARGVHYLHTGAKRTIFHRDIKPSNILLDNNLMPRLSDLGLSLQGPLSMSKPKPKPIEALVVGTYGYAAPEYVGQGIVTDKCDVYSFGMVLLYMVFTMDQQAFIDKANMLTNQHGSKSGNRYLEELFSNSNHQDRIKAFAHWFPVEEIIDPNLKGKIAPDCWEVFVDVTQRCSQEEPNERPTMGEVEVLLELALSLQEEADIRKTNEDYTLLSTTFIDKEPTICIYGEEMLCHQFSLVDLKQTTHNFTKRIVGRGRSGTMYQGHVWLNGATYYPIAIKKMDWSSICDSGMRWNFRNEIENICQLRHPNLASVLGFCDDCSEKILVYMYIPNGPLCDHLSGRRAKKALSWKKRLEICIGAAQGVDHLHTATIFHRNIKLSNILLDYDMMPKLSDFGFPWSKPIHAEAYAAPEWLQGQDFTYKCDVYSFGVVLLQVVSASKSPITIKVDIDPILKGKIAPQCWEVFLDITRRCLKFEANERPTMKEVKAQLQHALALQDEADAKSTGDYRLVSTTFESPIGGSTRN